MFKLNNEALKINRAIINTMEKLYKWIAIAPEKMMKG